MKDCSISSPNTLEIWRIMHSLPWITIFGSRVRRFANDFHEWRSHELKSLTNRLTSDPKIVIHGNECIILFLTRNYMSWTHNSAKNNYRSLISPLSLRTAFSVLVSWRHTNVRHWHCNVIFADCCCTRKSAQKRSSLVNNGREYRFSPTGIHGLACKKLQSCIKPTMYVLVNGASYR